MPDVNSGMYIYSTPEQENKMTTPEAAARYEAEHLKDMYGRKVVVFNPQNKPVDELPRIYGFNNGGSLGWYQAIAIAEDGNELGQHVCSTENYMPGDLGILEGTRDDRHTESYQKHYPDGYVMEFVPFEKVKSHEKLMKAFELAKELPPVPPESLVTIGLSDGAKITQNTDGSQTVTKPVGEELIEKVTEMLHKELQWEFGEDYDYGTTVDSLKDSFGEVSINSHSEPEDASWGRDLSINFYAGLKLGIRNTIKILRDNPELLKEAA